MSVRKAFGITATAQVVAFILGFAKVIVVSRLLTPAEIGIFSVAVSVLGFAHIFREFGVSTYLIQAKEVGREQLRAAFSLTLAFSWCIAAILYMGQKPIATFYEHEGIATLLALFSFNFIVMPFGTPLLSLLQRELRFKTLAAINIANSSVSTLITIGTAFAGESYLSMAWGGIAGHLTNIIILGLIRRNEIFILPSVRGVQEIFRFGSVSTLITVLSQIGSSAPDLILGRTLGFSSVAYYSRADGLRKMVLGQVGMLLTKVYFPSFAKNVREGHNPSEIYCRSANYLVAIMVPTMALLALLAEPLITLLFGPQWGRATPLATMLCLFTVITTPYSIAHLALTASGNLTRLLIVQAALQGTRIPILCASIWFELEQIVPALGLAFLTEAVLYQCALKKTIGLEFFRLMGQIRSILVLTPCTLIGPALLLHFYYRTGIESLDLLLVVFACSVFALLGWLFGVWITFHPFKTEISITIKRLALLKR